MADLAVNPKYSGYRLDHPDFGDVHKTTFAKGVVTEFQPLGDDPLKVASLVKVEVNGLESDFIPLFFHPKAQYWDDADGLATEVDAAGFNFKKAFMSFQSGDEVAAMLREGVPFAVVGFADGIPRIGEDIFKFAYEKWNGDPHFFHFQASTEWGVYGTFDMDVQGPDGVELGLTAEAELLCSTPLEPDVQVDGPSGTIWLTEIIYRQYFEWLIRIGPKAYILQVLNTYVDIQQWDAYVDEDEVWHKGGTLIDEIWSYNGINFGLLGAVDSKDLIDSARQAGPTHNSYSPTAIDNGDYCSDPSYNWYVDYAGFTNQSGCVDNFLSHHEIFPTSWMGQDIIDGSTIKIYIRPHNPA